MKIRICLYCLWSTLLLISTLAHAGGDYWPAKVEEKITNDVPQKIRLLIPDASRGIIKGCKQITVLLEYQRVPSWSWLPFVDTSHPSKQETAAAVEYLNKKLNNSTRTFFGYMGGGLLKVPSTDCIFKSKGLKLMHIDTNDEFAVLSFYDPV